MTPDMRDALADVGEAVTFADGETLREKGAFAPDMLLITSGQVDCILSDADAVHLSVGPETIVGEIGFLTGQGATATLRALGPVEALSLDASALQRLQQETPTIAADVLRHLAQLLQKRSVQNEGLLAEVTPEGDGNVEVIRCSTLDQSRTAQRLRYDVHCLEEGRKSASADADEGLIWDALDRTGTSFIAVVSGQAIGMMRVNFGHDDLGMLPELYGVLNALFSLDESALITASALRDAFRSDALHRHLLSAIETFAMASGARALFSVCPPESEGTYAMLNFTRSAPDFVHAEDGVLVPMVKALSAE